MGYEKNGDKQITRHHRKNRANRGTDDESNISLVPRKKHESFHTLFSTMNTSQIAEELNKVWIDPTYELVVVKRGA